MSGDDPRWEQVLAGLESVVDEASGLALLSLRPEEARLWVERLGRAESRLNAIRCRAMVEPDWTMLDSVRGKGDVAEVAAADRSTARGPISGDVNLGRWLAGFPTFFDAYADGRLSRPHVAALRRCHNRRTREYLAEAQDYLVQAAVDCDWTQFRQVLHRWMLSCDPDGAEPREQSESRSCRATRRYDGTWDGRFHLDPVAGHAVGTALEREEQRLWREDEAAAAETDDGPLPRTAAQRRADALVNLITRGASSETGGGDPPLVTVVLSERVAADAAARLAAGADDYDLADLPVDPDHRAGIPAVVGHGDPDRRCELIDGTPLHPHHGLAVATVATLRRVVLGAPSEITDLGRTVRTYPRRLKQALLVAGRGRCRNPGCTSPLTWLQADHVIPWILGGRTALANGQLLCDPHNKAKRDRPPDRGTLDDGP